MARNDRHNQTIKDEQNEFTVGETKIEDTEMSPAEVETTGPETKNGIIVGAMNVKVRKEPWADDDNVIEVLRRGDKVVINDKVGGFYKVSTSVHPVAYISSTFVKEE